MDDGGLAPRALHLNGLVGREGGVFQGNGVEAGGVLQAVGQRSEVRFEGVSGVLGKRMRGWVLKRRHRKLGECYCVTAGRQVTPPGLQRSHAQRTLCAPFSSGAHHNSSQVPQNPNFSLMKLLFKLLDVTLQHNPVGFCVLHSVCKYV